MHSNITANFSLLMLSNVSARTKDNSTKDSFRQGAIRNTRFTGKNISTAKKQTEFRDTDQFLPKRKISGQLSRLKRKSTRHTHREKGKPQPGAEKRPLRENKENRYTTSRNTHLPAHHPSTMTPERGLANKSTGSHPASEKKPLPDLKSNIKLLNEFAANSSALPEELRSLANGSNQMACRTEVICKALGKEGVEQLIHGNAGSTYQESQSPHSRQKRGWFGVDEKKLAAEMGPYVTEITAVLANKLQRSLVTVESMVENATDRVIATTEGYSVKADNMEDMVKNATQYVMSTTNGFSDRVGGIEDMLRNATQHVISTVEGFSDDTQAMKTMVKNATNDTQETSSHVRKILQESEQYLKHYIYVSGAFILASGLVCLLTAGCCHCRRAKNALELTINKSKLTDKQKFLIDLGHQLITRSAGGQNVSYKISGKKNNYYITIQGDDPVIGAVLEDALNARQENEKAPSSPLVKGDRSLSNSGEVQETTGGNESQKTGNPDSLKPDITIAIVPESTAASDRETRI